MVLFIKRFFGDIEKSEKMDLTLKDLGFGRASRGSPSSGYRHKWFRFD